MKHSVSSYIIHQPVYPGAADPRYFSKKATEILLAIISGVSALSVMMLLMAMA